MTRRESSTDAAYWMQVVASFTLWPVFLTALALKRFYSRGKLSSVDTISSEIEQLVFCEGGSAALFDFREVIFRYVGLAEACLEQNGVPLAAELIRITGLAHQRTAANCISRRDRQKLEFHRTMARNEFVELIATCAGISRSAENAVCLALKLSKQLNDDEATADLMALRPHANIGELDTSRPVREGLKTTRPPLSNMS
ncbi:MAG: hypothetical protein ABIV21_05670 [Pyrinomonadaceae bacterium]